MPSLMVAIPSFARTMKLPTWSSLGNAMWYACNHVELSRVVHRDFGGYDVARVRNQMAQAALDEDVDYILMVDSDMVIPRDGIANLMYHDVELCMGWAVKGSSDDGTTSVVRYGATNGYKDFLKASEINELASKGTHLLEVKGCGTCCALINTDVFRRFGRPWFKYEDRPDGTAMGEDYWFCQRCHDLRVKVHIDTRVGCGHIHDRVLEPR